MPHRGVLCALCLSGLTFDMHERGFVKAMGAASFGRANDMDSTSKKSPVLPRRDSASSLNDTDEKKKRGVFGMRRAFSKEKA